MTIEMESDPNKAMSFEIAPNLSTFPITPETIPDYEKYGCIIVSAVIFDRSCDSFDESCDSHHNPHNQHSSKKLDESRNTKKPNETRDSNEPHNSDEPHSSHEKEQEQSQDKGPKLLLLQRSKSDSYGGFWEGPGGTFEPLRDGNLFRTLVREVREESCLNVCRIVDFVGTEEWDFIAADESSDSGDGNANENYSTDSNGNKTKEAGNEEDRNKDTKGGKNGKGKKKAIKFNFVVDVHESRTPNWTQTKIKLNPDEHEAYIWATESEVRDVTEKKGGRFVFGGDEGGVFLCAFRKLLN